MAKANGSPVYVKTVRGHRYYADSIKKASRRFGLKDTGVHACLCGRQKQDHGYTAELAVSEMRGMKRESYGYVVHTEQAIIEKLSREEKHMNAKIYTKPR